MNYIILLSDGLRADFANEEHLMPNTYEYLRRRGGYKFLNAYSTSTWTLSAFGSLFSGLLPSNNGLNNITYGNRQKIVECDERFFKLSKVKDSDILMSKLQKQGYKTKYFGQKLMQKFMEHTLFHLFDNKIFWDFFYFQGDKIINERVEKPFLYFLYDDNGGHAPYGRLKRDKFRDYMEQKDDPNTEFVLDTTARANPEKYTSETLYKLSREQVKQYDEECLSVFWNWFEEKELYKDTYVFLLSDHSESLAEHGWTGHVYHAYESIVKIPLIVYSPIKDAGLKVVNDLVSLVDIYPTILEFNTYGDGVNLFNHKSDRAVFFEYERSGTPFEDSEFVPKDIHERVFIRGVRQGNYKFMVTKRFSGAKEVELYDVEADPQEKHLINNQGLRRKYFNKLKGVYGEEIQGFM